MNISVEIPIQGSKEQIWQVITDIEHASDRISGIEKVEVLEQPEKGLVGLKWRETRTLFGKTATEVMWITEAEAPDYYQTRAESHGAIYISQLSIHEDGGKQVLRMSFTGKPQSFFAKIMAFLTGFLFKGATKKALMKDLKDIKAAVEG